MAVLRPPLPSDGYTVISNDWIRDPHLSMRAKGILVYILSHSVGHQLTTEQMVAQSTDGRDGIRAGLRELEAAGYLRRQQHRGAGGKITSVDFVVVEPSDAIARPGKAVPGPDQPEQDVSAGETSDGFAGAGESDSKKTTTQKTREDQHTQTRGSRLSPDFTPDEAMRAWYVQEGIGRFIDGRVEHERFVNYWVAKPGAAGRKVDWPRTWMNWMREAAQRAQGGGRYPARSAPPAQRREYRTSEEKRTDKNRREQLKSRIFDEIVERERLDVSKPLVVREVSERAEAILNQLANGSGVETYSPDRYTGPDRDIVDAVWYETRPPREVTAA